MDIVALVTGMGGLDLLVGAVLGSVIGSAAGSAGVGVATGLFIGIGGGFVLRHLAAPVLSGFLGALTMWALLGPTTVPAPTVYIVLALAFAGALTAGLSNPRGCTMALTAFVGAILMLSGIIAMVASSYTLYPQFRTLTAHAIFYPFALLVPTVCGILLQAADARTKDAGSTLHA